MVRANTLFRPLAKLIVGNLAFSKLRPINVSITDILYSIALNVTIDSRLFHQTKTTIGVSVCTSCDSPGYCGCLDVKCNCVGPYGAYCSYCGHYPIGSKSNQDDPGPAEQATQDSSESPTS